MDWLRSQVATEPLRRSYRENLQYQVDPLEDIGDLGIDYFWCRCEELLPSDWSMGLFAAPDDNRPGKLMYQARAALISGDPALTELPRIVTEWRTTPLRAIENLFYGLRDG